MTEVDTKQIFKEELKVMKDELIAEGKEAALDHLETVAVKLLATMKRVALRTPNKVDDFLVIVEPQLLELIDGINKKTTFKEGPMKAERIKKIIRYTLNAFMDHLESQAVKLALLKLLGSATVGGIRARIITYIVKNIIFDKALEPLMKEVFFSIGYSLDKIEGHYKIVRLKEARNSGDEDAYDNARDDIYNNPSS